MIAGIAVLNNPDYVIERWHIWFIFVAVTWSAIGLNVFATRWLPLWNQFIRASRRSGFGVSTDLASSLLLDNYALRHHDHHPCLRRAQLSVSQICLF